MRNIRCDVLGCPASDKDFRSPAALGSHKFRAHGVKGTTRGRGAAKAEGKTMKASRKPRGAKAASRTVMPRRPRKYVRHVGLGLGRAAATNGASAIHSIRDQAERYRAKAKELDTLADRLKALL